MHSLHLSPPHIASRAQGTIPPSLAADVTRGLIGFTIVSVAGFIPWAVFGKWFRFYGGELLMYLTCALVFIALSGLLLHRLIMGHSSLHRFYKLFTLAFVAYSFAWIVGWMSLRGHAGSVVGLLAGTAVMGWVMCRAFEAEDHLFKVIASLFVLNALGYFIGGWVEKEMLSWQEASVLGISLQRPTIILLAKLQWGVCYGMGLGAGLGLAFHICQTRARALIPTTFEDS